MNKLIEINSLLWPASLWSSNLSNNIELRAARIVLCFFELLVSSFWLSRIVHHIFKEFIERHFKLMCSFCLYNVISVNEDGSSCLVQ